MAAKKVKDLKKGDLFKTAISNGSIVYLGYCKIDDIHDMVFYDPMSVKVTERENIRKMWYTPLTGKMKGLSLVGRAEENDMAFIQDPPGYITRVIKALFNL